MEVWLRVLSLRQLPLGAIRGSVRIQATLSEERRETGHSVSNRGSKSSQDAVWLKTPSSLLTWRLGEAELQRLKAYAPKFKLYVHTGEEVIAWCMLDVRDLVSGGLQEAQWLKLQGTGAGGEIRVAGGARYASKKTEGERRTAAGVQAGEGGGGAAGGRREEVEEEEEKGPDALPIGEGTDYFLLTIELARWGGDGRGLLLPGPASGPMWISYVLFGAVARTDGFESLGEQQAGVALGGHAARRSVDMFRLQSRGDASELAAWFSKHPVLDVYLCTAQRVIALAKVDLWAMAMARKGPYEAAQLPLPHESEERVVMESWEAEGPPGIRGGAWVDVRVRLERVEGGPRLEPLIPMAAPTDQQQQAPPSSSAVSEPGALDLLERGQGGGPSKDEEEEEEEDGNYSDDFGSEGGGASPTARGHGGRDEEEEGRGGQEEDEGAEGEDWGRARRAAEQEPKEEEEDDKGRGGGSATGLRVEGGELAASDGEEDDEEEEPESASPPPPKPGGPRRLRLSIDLRSVRDLSHSQHVFLFYHYPHLVPPPSVLDNPVLSHPVWVTANIETAMDRSCCVITFTGTFASLAHVADAHPFVVSVRAKEGAGGGGGFEIGKAVLPFSELLESRPINYRCPGRRTRLYRSYQACEKALKKLVGRGEAEGGSVPVTVYAVDKYAPIVGKDGLGGGQQQGAIPSLHAVMVLEDMGPAGHAPAPAPDTADSAQSSVRLPRLAPPAPPMPSASDMSAAMGMLELERRKIEFEDWRHRREVEWTEQLRAKEAARMEELEASFVDRERERKAVFAKAQEDLNRLEAKLRKSVLEAEARERRLSSYEEELKAEASKRAVEVQALQRRLRDDARHMVEVERQKTKEAEERIARLEKALASSEKKHDDLQEEFNRYRRDQRKSPASVLHGEIAQLKGEKSELEARWERERAEKNAALLEKEQYRSALQRTARALKREQGRHLTNVRQELEQLKLEYLAREERYRLDGERDELRTIKKELDALRHLSLSVHNAMPPAPPVPSGLGGGASNKENLMMMGLSAAPPQAWPYSKDSLSFGGGAVHAVTVLDPSPPPPPPRSADLSPVHPISSSLLGEEACGGDPELARLRSEREDLLSTGVYSVADPIIQELSRLIGEREGHMSRGPDPYSTGGSSGGGARRAAGLDFE